MPKPKLSKLPPIEEAELKGFNRGYYCAVATMLRMEGMRTPQIDELFRAGGEVMDPEDSELFKIHGLKKQYAEA